MMDMYLDAPDNPDMVDVAEMYERAEYAKHPKLCFRCTCEDEREYAAPAVIVLGHEWLCERHAKERIDE